MSSQKIKFLDVGHADSSVIYLNDRETNDIKTIIIDIVNADKLINELVASSIVSVDLLIISHFDADHCKGVNDFLEKYSKVGNVKKICYNIDRKVITQTMSLILKRFAELYHKQKIAIIIGANDSDVQKRELMSNETTKFYLIHPNAAEVTENCLNNNTNDMSIVCLFENEKCSIVFTGDLENNGWGKLLMRMPDLECNILKMPHHGAFYTEEKGIGTRYILERLNPDVAIISTGENKRYKHPSEETIKMLKEKNIKVYCTEYTSLCDCNKELLNKKCYGDVEVTVNASGYAISTESDNMSLLKCSACENSID